ncbi:hypothetical protein [Bizionia argentinensis]|nr:hypothetical protein [Bizionia argentinensis]
MGVFGYVEIYGTFDVKDMIAGVISGIATFILKELIDKTNANKI